MSQEILSQPVANVLPSVGTRTMKRADWVLLGLTGLSALMLIAALYMVFGYAPMERTMGMVQKIFYFHVPTAWVAGMAFLQLLIMSALYLWKRWEWADMSAVAAGEIGLVFAAMNILSGAIWARPIWNTWWTWDPRLTTATICWLVYVAYFMLRGAVDDPLRGRRMAAVYGLVAFITVPMTYFSISLLRTIHPNLLGNQDGAKGNSSLTPEMLRTFLFCLLTFTVLYGTLFWHRMRLESVARMVETAKAHLAAGE